MKKIAFFVEGPTEGDFVKKLLQEYTSKRRLVKIFEGYGGRRSPRVFNLKYEDRNLGQDYLIHIYISSTDNRVISDARDNLLTLRAAGFSAVIALRDLRGDKTSGVPRTLADLPAMELSDQRLLRNTNPHVSSVIAVMEIETWFIADTNHYRNIDTGLTRTLIEANLRSLSANPYTDNLTLVSQPAEMLDGIYSLRGKHYSKDATNRLRTINALDYANLYLNVSARLMKLQQFFTILDNVF